MNYQFSFQKVGPSDVRQSWARTERFVWRFTDFCDPQWQAPGIKPTVGPLVKRTSVSQRPNNGAAKCGKKMVGIWRCGKAGNGFFETLKRFESRVITVKYPNLGGESSNANIWHYGHFEGFPL